ncbi:hypothetical protein [Sulfurimonas sp.]|uniref:hypothetical protein n=1 Tax=Sulfurimonas sp. TaxID=2022749 RepID=UPI00356ABB6D
MDNFEKDYIQMFDGIDLCLAQNLQFPTLTLIYSAIDSLAWIAYGDKKNSFTSWVDEYMYKEKKLVVTSLDLYSARCSIIHRLTPDSRLINEKKASTIAYAWGNADIELLEQSIIYSDYKDLKAIHINDLYESLRLGTLRFKNSDKLKNKDCVKRINEHYGNLSRKDLEKFNNLS